MVFGLDVAAGQEAVQAVTDPDVVAIGHRGPFRGRVVDEGPVGALQVRGQIAVDIQVEPRMHMAARDREIVDGDIAVIAAAQDDRFPFPGGGEEVPIANSGRVDMDKARASLQVRDKGRFDLDLLGYGLDSHGNPPPTAGRSAASPPRGAVPVRGALAPTPG